MCGVFQDQGAVDEKAQIRSHTLYARSGGVLGQLEELRGDSVTGV